MYCLKVKTQNSIAPRRRSIGLVVHGKSAAFTLIELLVVISIIVLLISILLPALGSARLAGQRTRSLVNVKQISTALFIYAGDSKDSMPFQQEYARNGSGVYFPIAIHASGAAFSTRADTSVRWMFSGVLPNIVMTAIFPIQSWVPRSICSSPQAMA